MFYVYRIGQDSNDQAIIVDDRHEEVSGSPETKAIDSQYGEGDIDFVDDSLLNPAPHNAIEQQLLRGDVIGLALMSGAIIWSAMGAFG
ncbi:hypothetical protein [Hansschlegelia zhihuaiae]|uniref:Uncharacterized protein n=1 Tax=Hansschlegelia zhihuaiae TaxID=405005 RepID=A0A4Q0MMX2_9HYPH|nr:hypothetical protein [Hansschlegelia zhihuaiae]RXF75118.1 hypothetical protein EK403_03465 [Hansschlegelia zhihuaiae]